MVNVSWVIGYVSLLVTELIRTFDFGLLNVSSNKTSGECFPKVKNIKYC